MSIFYFRWAVIKAPMDSLALLGVFYPWSIVNFFIVRCTGHDCFSQGMALHLHFGLVNLKLHKICALRFRELAAMISGERSSDENTNLPSICSRNMSPESTMFWFAHARVFFVQSARTSDRVFPAEVQFQLAY